MSSSQTVIDRYQDSNTANEPSADSNLQNANTNTNTKCCKYIKITAVDANANADYNTVDKICHEKISYDVKEYGHPMNVAECKEMNDVTDKLLLTDQLTLKCIVATNFHGKNDPDFIQVPADKYGIELLRTFPCTTCIINVRSV